MLSHIRFSIVLCAMVTTYGFAQSKSPAKISNLNAGQPVSTCIAEANAGSPVDLACSIPSNALYSIELFAKDGDENSGGWNWKNCQTSGAYRCPDAAAGWSGLGEIPEGGTGMKSVQARLVPDGGVKRGRLKVSYQVPPNK